MNWTLEVSIIFISLLPCLLASILMLMEYRKSKNRHSLLFFLGFFMLTLLNLTEALGYLFLNPLLIFAQATVSIVMAFIIILIVDTVNIERLDYIKLTLLTILSTMLVISMQYENAVTRMTWPSGELSLVKGGAFRIIYFIMSMGTGLLFIYLMYKINRHAPLSLKKYSRINLLGAFIAGALPPILFGTGITLYVPGIVTIVLGIGMLLISYAFYHCPALGFVLPFKAIKLFVINTESGLCLFEYTWDPTTKWGAANLFAGLFQGIAQLSQETIKRGKLQKIYFEEGVLLIKSPENSPIYCVLLSTKSSYYLQQALTLFTQRFIEKFPESMLKTPNVQSFRSANKIIMDIFPYIPPNE